MIPPIL